MSDVMLELHDLHHAELGLPSCIRSQTRDGETKSKDKPCISVEFPALVDAKYEKHILAGAICLIQNFLVVLLCRPDICLNTQI